MTVILFELFARSSGKPVRVAQGGNQVATALAVANRAWKYTRGLAAQIAAGSVGFPSTDSIQFGMTGESDRTQAVLYRRIALAAGAMFIAIDLLAIAARRTRNSGDFDISMEFGRRFLAGRQLYQGGLHFPYLPTAAMFFSIFSALP
ncbi:MAG TPA: hypothetical protein VGH29_05190, partial [Candidatus Binataceae bacterium]